MPYESEDDVRFAYCSVAICVLLDGTNDKVADRIDVDALLKYLKSCQSYDGGFSWIPNGESHAGLTYCTLGVFRLLGRMEDLDDVKENILEWLVSRQLLEVNGFQGRINKVPDT